MKHIIIDFIIGTIAAIAVIGVASFGFVNIVNCSVFEHMSIFAVSTIVGAISIAKLIARNANITE